MRKKGYDKKVALKLINQYADQYNRVAEENKCIKMQINDLQSNIVINKQIIEAFLLSCPLEEKANQIILKYKEENSNLQKIIKNLSDETTKLFNKIKSYEEIMNKSIFEYRESTDCLNDRIFILENALVKKDNCISSLTNQLTKLKEDIKSDNCNHGDNNYDDSNNRNEIYIIDPNVSVNLIQDDLMLYKEAYENALMKIKESTTSLEKSEKKVEDLKNELMKFQNYTCSSPSYHTKSNKEYLSDDESDIKIDNIMALGSISSDEIDIVSQTNIGIRILNILNRALGAHNNKIIKLQNDVNLLIDKNRKLTNENMILYKSVLELKKNSNFFRNNSYRDANNYNIADHYLNTNISMIGNTNRDDKKYKNKKKLHNLFNTNIIHSEKANQSADDISVELTTNEEVVRKNNLTDISGDFIETNIGNNNSGNIYNQIDHKKLVKKYNIK